MISILFHFAIGPGNKGIPVSYNIRGLHVLYTILLVLI